MTDIVERLREGVWGRILTDAVARVREAVAAAIVASRTSTDTNP